MTPQKYESVHPGVLNITETIEQRVLIKKVEMHMTGLKGMKIIYDVTILMAIITEDGKVKDPCVIRTYRPDFDRAIIEAVKQWQYTPATKDGKPVSVFFTVRANPEF